MVIKAARSCALMTCLRQAGGRIVGIVENDKNPPEAALETDVMHRVVVPGIIDTPLHLRVLDIEKQEDARTDGNAVAR